MKKKVLNGLETFSRAMITPLIYFSVAGMLLSVGALLTGSGLRRVLPVLDCAPVQQLGKLLYGCMMLLVQNIGLLLCVGIAAVAAKREKQQVVLIALMSFMVYLMAGHVGLAAQGALAESAGTLGLYGTGQTQILGVQTVDMGALGGILLGLAVSWIYNRTCGVQFRGVVSQLYSGVRWSFVCSAAFAMALGWGSCYFMPPVQHAISALTGWMADSGSGGLFLYGCLERLLIPTGLHHLVYAPFQFTALGGSITVDGVTSTGAYAVLMTEYAKDLPFSHSVVWMYTGFTKTFGYFGIAAAFIFCARKENRRSTAAMLIPLVLTASLASITEPMDFLFCFTAPVLWAAHGIIAGSFVVLLDRFHVTGFTSNLISSLLMNLTAGADRTRYPVLYLLALCEMVVYFVVFTVLIRALDLPTPGRAAPPREEKQAELPDPEELEKLLRALGGAENIRELDHCFTRLRIALWEPEKLDEALLGTLSHKGFVKRGDRVQIVWGLQAQAVCQALWQQLKMPELC